jgi:hypothetical protein
MLDEIKADAITTYEVTPDGMWFSLRFKLASGEAGAITLPTDCLKQLVMTMPCIAAEALRKQHGGGEMRLVYPLGDWSLSTTESETHLILTLGTPDGFQIAFAIEARDVVQITSTMYDHVASGSLSPPTLN